MKQYKQGGQVATDILTQLGGANRLYAMTGAYNFVDLGNGISFRIKNQRANFIKVTVSGLDLYDLEVGRIRGMDYKVVAEEKGLYNDMLKSEIEKITGMTLTMPRVIGFNYKEGGEIGLGDSFAITKFNDPKHEYEIRKYANKELVVLFARPDGTIEAFVRSTGEKVPFKIDRKHIEKYSKGGDVARKYKLGDKYSSDFDYEGMLTMGLSATIEWDIAKLQKLADSFEDVNYHTASEPLFDVIEYLKANNKDAAELSMFDFYNRIIDEFNSWKEDEKIVVSEEYILPSDKDNSEKSFVSKLKEEYESMDSYDVETAKDITNENVSELLNAGYSEEDIRIIYFGYGIVLADKIKADNEFESSIGGVMMADATIDEYVENGYKDKFSMGLKYPKFNWDKVIDKYKINKQPKIIYTDWRVWGQNGEATQYKYQIFEGENVVLGNSLGYNDRDKKGQVKFSESLGYPKEITDGKFNDNYWGVVSSSKEVLKDIAKMLLSQKDGYLKNINMFVNHLGGIDSEELDFNNINYGKDDEDYSLFPQLLKEYDSLDSYSKDNAKYITQENVDKLRRVGYNREDIRIIYFGYGVVFADEIKSEGEFVGNIGGLMTLMDEYVQKTIDEYVRNGREGRFSLGLKYPDFNWSKVISKYKIDKTPKVVKSEWREVGSNGETMQYEYQIFEGSNVVIGNDLGHSEKDKNGKIEYSKAWGENKEITNGKFNGGYWGVVSSSKEVLKDIAKMLLSQPKGYLKDIDMFINGLGGIDYEPLDYNRIKYAKGGDVYGFSDARTKGAESQDFEADAIEECGGKAYWDKLNPEEKRQMIVDVEREWYRGTHFEGGGETTKYYDTYVSIKNGFDLYYYDNKTGRLDIYVGNFGKLEEAESKAENEGYEKRPMYMRNDDENPIAKGGNIQSLLKKQTLFNNQLTDIKLGADLHTQKGVEEYRRKINPIKDMLIEIEKQLDEAGYEAFEDGGTMEKGGNVSVGKKWRIDFTDSKENKGYDILEVVNTKHFANKYSGGLTVLSKVIDSSDPDHIGRTSEDHIDYMRDVFKGKYPFTKKLEDGGAINSLNKVTENREEMISFLCGEMGKSGMSDKQYDQLERRLQAKSYIQLKNLYEAKGGKKQMAYGGSIAEQNKLMVQSQVGEIEHHVKELMESLEGDEEIPAWVVAKTAVASSDLSDVAHYLEGIEKELDLVAVEDEINSDDDGLVSIERKEPEIEFNNDEEDSHVEEHEYENEDGNYGIDGFERGGSLNKQRFTKNDFNRLTNDGFEGIWEDGYWSIKEEDKSKVLGKFNENKETIVAVGSKKIDNPLVKWLQQNSYVSNDEYYQLAAGGVITEESYKELLDKKEGEKWSDDMKVLYYWNHGRLSVTLFYNKYRRSSLKDVINNASELSLSELKKEIAERLKKLKVQSKSEYAAGGVIEVNNFHKNRMGTLSFDIKLSGMRKSQDFIVYPVSQKSDTILIQSDTRIGQIRMTDGKGVMSQSHANGAYGVHLSMDKLVPFELTESQLKELKENLSSTAGSSVGSRNVLSDNSFADKFAEGGSIYENGLTKDQWYNLGLTLESGIAGFSGKIKGGKNKAGDVATGEINFEEKPMFFAKNWSKYGKFVYIDKDDKEYSSTEVPSTLLGSKDKFAKGGITSDIPEIVKRAMTETITDIGQLSHQELLDLNRYVRKDILIKGKGGSFPKEKTVYAIKGYDIHGARERDVKEMLETSERIDRASGNGKLWYRKMSKGGITPENVKLSNMLSPIVEINTPEEVDSESTKKALEFLMLEKGYKGKDILLRLNFVVPDEWAHEINGKFRVLKNKVAFERDLKEGKI